MGFSRTFKDSLPFHPKMVPYGFKMSQSIWHCGYGLEGGGGCPSLRANWLGGLGLAKTLASPGWLGLAQPRLGSAPPARPDATGQLSLVGLGHPRAAAGQATARPRPGWTRPALNLPQTGDPESHNNRCAFVLKSRQIRRIVQRPEFKQASGMLVCPLIL